MRSNFENFGLTGKLLESDYFGPSVRISAESIKFLKDFGRPAQRGGVYLPREKSIEYVRKFYAQDPHNPQKPIAQELFRALLKKLSIKDAEKLSFYSAIDTPLDFFHGTDGFFELDNVRLALDLTANLNKDEDENFNVDFVLYPFSDKTKDEYSYSQEMEEVSSFLAKMFREKIKKQSQKN